jgi:NAD(P)-dependent dehydrogenase (short-subunit alcohol dehydrogenase family)
MTDSLFDLTGRVAVVTGGSGTLGSAMCRALARAGAAVAVLARSDASNRALAAEITAAGGNAAGFSVDVLDHAALQETSQRILDRFGRIDILVNAAGGNRPEAIAMPGQRTFFDLPPEALRWVFDLNLSGTIYPSQVFGQAMVQQGSGSIINISSMASMRPLTRVVAYAAAKAAVNNFTQWLAVTMAREHSPHIRVNAIAPGFFLSEQNHALLIDAATGDLTPRGRTIIEHTPAGRFGEPTELDGALLWLASDASRFVTGIVVPVDGGFSAFSGV